ncbi:aminotransferase class V-fold PLP-dependent enzyme [Haloarcula marina]|uniref:aminotransferase class V-fold PLP-dependent enzyme n=1 Tax=Haloarcula marina TaxID=2961574 RepID=UPI0020B77591|nr:aminotransferase class V-fold PLP-dependent enzyme [Halomicroarcula marina]
MDEHTTIYDELGIPPVINAAGTKTRIGGSLIRPEAVEAMSRASESFVRISDLQIRAGELIQDVTGAEAGYVVSGAAASMTLGIAACIAGDDLGVMSTLPDTEGVADEVVMPRSHRNGYDHAIRAAGATIVDVGNNDNYLGTGSKNTELWEIADAINDETVAVAYMEKSYSQPDLEDVVEVAHERDVPVLVDAAAELPPKSNLEKFIDQGADLVVFSGGKAIRGPQTTGILAGRADLIGSAAMQHLDMHVAEEVWEPPADLINIERFGGVPRQGIGRQLKVGKEELVGLIRALELFVEEDTDELVANWEERSRTIAAALAEAPGYETTVEPAGKTNIAATVWVSVDADKAGIDTGSLVSELRKEDPRVFVGPDHIHESAFTVNPSCLTDEESEYVIERLLAHHQ